MKDAVILTRDDLFKAIADWCVTKKKFPADVPLTISIHVDGTGRIQETYVSLAKPEPKADSQ